MYRYWDFYLGKFETIGDHSKEGFDMKFVASHVTAVIAKFLPYSEMRNHVLDVTYYYFQTSGAA